MESYMSLKMDNRFEAPGGAGTDNTLVSEGHNLFTSITFVVLADDPTTTVDGQVWRTSAGLRGQVGSDLGTFTFVPD